MSLLVDRKAAAAAAPSKAGSLLAAARARTPRGDFVELPVLGRVWIQLPGDTVVAEIEGAVFSAMEALGLAPTPMNSQSYGTRRLALTLAWAVRNPDKTDERAGSSAEWCAEDPDMLAAYGMAYNDVRERLSPLSMDTLTPEEFDAIRLGIEKKNPTPLLSCGVVALATYLLTTAAPPANSPTMQSSTGPS